MIEISDVKFKYHKSAFNSFSLFIDSLLIGEGEFVSILGPNGSGKSTLLKLLANLLSAEEGLIKINGMQISKYSFSSFAKNVSYVPQKNYSVFPFSVFEVVMMGRTPYLGLMGFEKEEDLLIINEAMATMQVDHLKNKGINELSGGELQRVFIARALAQKAKIVLLDEPNSHLDIKHQVMIYDLLRNLCSQQKLTIVNVSHDLNLVGVYSHRIILMNEGKVALDGSKESILKKENIYRYFGINAEVIINPNNSINVFVRPN